MQRSTRILKGLLAVAALGLIANVAWASAPGGRYQPGSCSGLSVYDTKTKLIWQQRPYSNPSASWTTAVDYCKTVRDDQFRWRMPTAKELATVVDYTAFANGAGTAVDGSQFSLESTVIWSSSPDASGALTVPPSGGEAVPSAYAVDFSTGQVVLKTMNQSLGVWCVSDHGPVNCI